MEYMRPKKLYYRIAQAASWIVSKAVFRRKFLRNEIRGKKGPFVVIANHQTALDFVNLIGATRQPMAFVISNSFYSSLPIKGFMDKMGVIPKQQFQTTVKDMKRIKAVIDNGDPLVIYPAGLMCEDGLSTPIPGATYKFLKWLGADVYVAKAVGTYFVMPKWTGGMRPGRTTMDIYKLFSAEELAQTDVQTVKEKTEEALLFDAYREQEQMQVAYKKNDDLNGLENVLYMCPHCKKEFTISVRDKNTLCCSACGYEQISDKYGFLHNEKGIGPELRYVSDWSKLILDAQKVKILSGAEIKLSSGMKIHMIDGKKNKFIEVGSGTLTLTESAFLIDGTINDEPVQMEVSIAGLPTLPFSPGKRLEIQVGKTIYRCVLDDGKLTMKFINMLKNYYQINDPSNNRKVKAKV